MKLARNYDKMSMRAKAVEILKSAIKKYPDTKAAAVAKAMLTAME